MKFLRSSNDCILKLYRLLVLYCLETSTNEVNAIFDVNSICSRFCDSRREFDEHTILYITTSSSSYLLILFVQQVNELICAVSITDSRCTSVCTWLHRAYYSRNLVYIRTLYRRSYEIVSIFVCIDSKFIRLLWHHVTIFAICLYKLLIHNHALLDSELIFMLVFQIFCRNYYYLFAVVIDRLYITIDDSAALCILICNVCSTCILIDSNIFIKFQHVSIVILNYIYFFYRFIHIYTAWSKCSY